MSERDPHPETHSEKTARGRRRMAEQYVAANAAGIKHALATLAHQRNKRHIKTRDLAREMDVTQHTLVPVLPVLLDRGWLSKWSDAKPYTYHIER